MTALVVLTVVVAWIVASAVTAAVWSVVIRGGLQEDRARGYVRER
jgi:hypothetical protein